MRNYVYFAVGVDTTSILNSKPGCDIRTQKSFDSLFTTFVEGLSVDKKRTGFIGRCEILADDRLDDIEYVTGGAYGTDIIDCFNIRFYKQKNNKFNASLIFAENGKENLINICKKIDEFYSPKKKIKPMEKKGLWSNMKAVIGKLIKNIFIFVGVGYLGLALLMMLLTAKGNAVFPALIENLSAGISVLVCMILGAINLILASFIHTK